MLTPTTLALFGTIGTPEIIILALLGLLIFGKRLPEVGKSLGRGIVEFKKGLSGVEDDLDQAGRSARQLDRDAKPTGTAAGDKAAAGRSTDQPA